MYQKIRCSHSALPSLSPTAIQTLGSWSDRGGASTPHCCVVISSPPPYDYRNQLLLDQIFGPYSKSILSTGSGSPGCEQDNVFHIIIPLKTFSWRYQEQRLRPSTCQACMLLNGAMGLERILYTFMGGEPAFHRLAHGLAKGRGGPPVTGLRHWPNRAAQLSRWRGSSGGNHTWKLGSISEEMHKSNLKLLLNAVAGWNFLGSQS